MRDRNEAKLIVGLATVGFLLAVGGAAVMSGPATAAFIGGVILLSLAWHLV